MTESKSEHPPVQQYYRFHSRIYDATRWMFLFNRKSAIKACELSLGDSVLEIGCGTGLNLHYLEQKVGERGRIVGVDFSSEMLNKAQRKVQRWNWKNIELVQANAESFTLDQPVDAVLFSYSLTMIPNWRAAVDHSMKNLKSGGRLVVLDFAKFNLLPSVFGKVLTWHLKRNHVDVRQPHADYLMDKTDRSTIRYNKFGLNFLFSGVKHEPTE